MARPRRVDMELVTQAQVVAAQATDVDSLRCAQAVMLPAVLGATLEQTAMLLGVGRASVLRMQSRLRELCADPGAVRPGWGGRRRASLTPQEESDFLARWQEDSNAGGVLVASPLRAALAQRLGHPVAASVVYRMLARHGWRKVAPDTRHPNSDPQVQEEWKKKLPETLAALMRPEDVQGRPVRLMFQDEARFGRMVRIRRCWAPNPKRPTVCNGYEREFVYVYGAVSPIEGEFDWMTCRQMNTERMTAFLAQVSSAHATEFMLMVVDGASSHVSKDLVIPENIRLLRLPPYAPELNPQEHVWDEVREKEFPNRVFNDLPSVIRQLEAGLPRLAANTKGLRSLTAWPWIISLNLKAT